MPPKKAPAAEGAEGGNAVSGLRENELRFIKAVFDNMTQKPDADWSKVALDLNLKDAKCAKERFRQMSVRHGWRAQAPSNNNPSPTPSPSKGKKGPTGPSGDGKVTKRRTPRKAAPKKEESSDTDVVKKDEDVKAEEDETEAEVVG